ncbi:aminotransferase class III-fold pyridoxal phosphate-dependent enzyme [Flavobacteriaceae bacterium M23B6Z8]
MKTSEERLNELSPLKKALFKIKKYQTELDRLKNVQGSGDIAIIGMSLKFPDAETPDEFWNNLMQKKDHIKAFPQSRKKQLEAYYRSMGKSVEDISFQEGAYLDHIDLFDADFFGFPTGVATGMHPLQRLYLKTSWRALEDAGCLNENHKNVGVYFGASGDLSYAQYIDIIERSEHKVNPATLMGNTNSIASSRLSYFMDLKGPAVTLDTACSSSLVAVHQACNALWAGDCELAIAGGGKLYMLPEKDKYNVGFESPTGKTKPFDANADGAGVGEGIAAIVLKPLELAKKDNDNVYAVIKGSSINQDGTSAGITAPNPKAQTHVISSAARKAGVSPDSLSFIETHGTGTSLGDPIEFEALKEAFGQTKKHNYCAIGALKSNLGHLFEAAGIAGLIKCVLALQHKMIPATINHQDPNENVSFNDSPFYLNTESVSWEVEGPRRCGVSSFGISGTNAHVILEEFEAVTKPEAQVTNPLLFTLSAHNESTLKELAVRCIDWLKNTDVSLRDAVYSNNSKRNFYNVRFGTIVKTKEELINQLDQIAEAIVEVKESYAMPKELLRKTTTETDAASALQNILQAYRNGAIINWIDFYKDVSANRVAIPTYPLHEISCWPVFDPNGEKALIKEEADQGTAEMEELTYDKIFAQLSKMIEIDTGVTLDASMAEEDFFDLGIDSIVIMHFIQTIDKQYNVKLEMGQFYEVVNNLDKLTSFILKNGVSKEKKSAEIKLSTSNEYKAEEKDYFVPYKEIEKQASRHFSPEQEAHLNELTERIVSQTSRSKEITQKYRKALANNRNVAGFRPETKEITYQIIAKNAKGAKITDLDGNEYVDLTMGFGVNLLGYNPDFIQEKLQEALRDGYPVGPMSDIAGEVAELITELTGNERVAFYNSGSEAVMVALRLARAVTGRSKFVLFKESYHGTFDGILALNNPLDPENAMPLAPGISDNYIQNTIVLEYGTKESIEFIREHASELAAILIEPVQSRRPDIQPIEFLKELRKITDASGSALIFDEVITGFRIHPGGAQAWYDIKADLCTYGKIVGGGMPVGVVSGSSRFMDAVDGGHWSFGDDSYPDKPTTFVAGTFNQHPLTMVASLAILSHLKEQGPKLQRSLNEKTAVLARRLNSYFTKQHIEIEVRSFGSLFRFVMKGGWDLFYQHLLANKVYVWEGRNCFLSTAHTDEDIEFVYQAIVKSVEEIRSSGWMNGSAVSNKKVIKIPLTEDQEQLYAWSSSNEESSSSFNENQILDLKGALSVDILEQAVQLTVNRHQALRTVKIDQNGFHIQDNVNPQFEILEFTQLSEAQQENLASDFLSKQGAVAFDLSNGPFIRFLLLKVSGEHHRLLMTTHHLVADGYSLEIIWSELSKFYASLRNIKPIGMLPSGTLSSFNNWIQNPENPEETANARKFWKNTFKKRYPEINLPSKTAKSISSKKGSSYSKIIESTLEKRLVDFAKSNKLTLFNVFLAAYKIMLYKLSGQQQLVAGIPASGQLLMGENILVGQCVKMLPVHSEIELEDTVTVFMNKIRLEMNMVLKYQKCSFNEILASDDELKMPKITTEIDMNSIKNELSFDNLSVEFSFPAANFAKYDLSVSIIEMNDHLSADFYYNTGLFDDATIKSWASGFIRILTEMIENPSNRIKDINMEDVQETAAFSMWNKL